MPEKPTLIWQVEDIVPAHAGQHRFVTCRLFLRLSTIAVLESRLEGSKPETLASVLLDAAAADIQRRKGLRP